MGNFIVGAVCVGFGLLALAMLIECVLGFFEK
jgi:hypothetical protein